MIVSKIYGGLAGQMLQYSIGRHLSIKNNTDLYLDTTWYNKKKSSKFIRDFGLHNLNTCYKIIGRKEILWWKIKITNKIGIFSPFNLKLFKETDFAKFNSEVLNEGDYIILDGYWNSYKYFEDIRDILLNELRPKQGPNIQNQHFLTKIRKENSIGVHFRRGDYALTTFHGILSKKYYSEAIDLIFDEVQNPYLFIFSDEPEWVQSNMEFSLPYEIVNINKDDTNFWDLELMKNCKHNIIANSGFSWWAAWLNNNPDKIVISPKNWINTEKTQIDNIPNNWILL